MRIQFSHSVVSNSLGPHGLQHGQASVSGAGACITGEMAGEERPLLSICV